MENIILRKIKLPSTVRGFVILDNESDYNIYLNASNSVYVDQKALQHEIEHIENDDFYSLDDVIELEK